MLNSFQNTVIVIATMLAATGFLLLLQRLWPSKLRRQHNDLIGWHVSVLGSTYAVILGFMLFAVWTNFQVADANADSEANCLVGLVRSSRALPDPQRGQLLKLAVDYTNVMLTSEWPAMSRSELSPASRLLIRQLWATLTSAEIRTMREQSALDHTLTELTRMTEYRRLRQLQVKADLPGILWLVLILGATVTIMSACLFGSFNLRLHLFQVMVLAFLISSILVAIGDINHPFQGSVHVTPAGFERARFTLAETP